MTSGLADAYNIDDLRTLAKRRLPRGIFEFLDRGAEDEVTMRANRHTLRGLAFAPRVGIDVSTCNTARMVLGTEIAAPFATSATGLSSMLWHDGELAQARAAAAAGIPVTISHFGLAAIEDLAAIPNIRLWAQAYWLSDEGLVHHYLQRLAAAGVRTLLVTMDVNVPPNREYNMRNKMMLPFSLTSRTFFDMLWHPRWLFDVPIRYHLRGKMPQYENLPPDKKGTITSMETARHMMLRATLNWNDIATLRKLWTGNLVVKGLSMAEDAKHALACGCDGVVVSNHGGRALDGSPSSIEALPYVVDAVGDRMTVLMDGGIRRGADVVRALSLGAQAVLVGRPNLYGLAAAGEAGVARAIEILRSEVARVLGLLGCPDINDLSRKNLFAHAVGLSSGPAEHAAS